MYGQALQVHEECSSISARASKLVAMLAGLRGRIVDGTYPPAGRTITATLIPPVFDHEYAAAVMRYPRG
jgi:hypothetical protein